MKNLNLIVLLLLFITNSIFAFKPGTLSEVLKPQMIDISGEKLYVLDDKLYYLVDNEEKEEWELHMEEIK